MFDNNPMNRTDVNNYNEKNLADVRIIYQPFYTNGRFQIPRLFNFNMA